MSFRPSTAPPIQDMPPPGGYKKVNSLKMSDRLQRFAADFLDFGRYLPSRGPKGWQLWLGSATLIAYGYYQIGATNTAKIQQKMQERKVRYALAPLLQAEADREYMERELVALLKERDLMKDVKDEQGRAWEAGASPFWGGQWMPRRIGHFMRHHG
ncbi:hypothetical protein HJC23_010570 [Cyclotella cryptica]|uniref:NADH dehydrogenase [ubiquinone] 1 alpha subcomplex subunit 13 n=1 Tax=Cyclotella cryptica TaxID=29204 RepID=A0ABD3NXM8_9STRA